MHYEVLKYKNDEHLIACNWQFFSNFILENVKFCELLFWVVFFGLQNFQKKKNR